MRNRMSARARARAKGKKVLETKGISIMPKITRQKTAPGCGCKGTSAISEKWPVLGYIFFYRRQLSLSLTLFLPLLCFRSRSRSHFSLSFSVTETNAPNKLNTTNFLFELNNSRIGKVNVLFTMSVSDFHEFRFALQAVKKEKGTTSRASSEREREKEREYAIENVCE